MISNIRTTVYCYYSGTLILKSPLEQEFEKPDLRHIVLARVHQLLANDNASFFFASHAVIKSVDDHGAVV